MNKLLRSWIDFESPAIDVMINGSDGPTDTHSQVNLDDIWAEDISYGSIRTRTPFGKDSTGKHL